jgi:hypothetical protein
MKFVQSYSVIKEWNYKSPNYEYLYSMLFSFLQLKKHYNEFDVVMVCDQMAYDDLIQYIPYDEIIIKETPYAETPKYWSLYKHIAVEDMNEPFIHIDSDVFIFDKIFDTYINNPYDTITQNFSNNLDDFNGFYDPFIENDLQKLYDLNIVDENFRMGSISAGIFGFKNPDKFKEYLPFSKKLMELDQNNVILNNYHDHSVGYYGIICEEFAFYLYLHNQKNHEHYVLLPNNIIPTDFNNKYNYTHLIGAEKHKHSNINIIKNIIKTEYKDYSHYIDKYDLLILEKIK